MGSMSVKIDTTSRPTEQQVYLSLHHLIEVININYKDKVDVDAVAFEILEYLHVKNYLERK